MGNRVELEKRYSTARGNLLLVAVFSLVNIALLLFDAGVSFLFSATVPSFLVEMGLLFMSESALSALGGICFALGFAAVGVYGLFYWLSKKHKAFMLDLSLTRYFCSGCCRWASIRVSSLISPSMCGCCGIWGAVCGRGPI